MNPRSESNYSLCADLPFCFYTVYYGITQRSITCLLPLLGQNHRKSFGLPDAPLEKLAWTVRSCIYSVVSHLRRYAVFYALYYANQI